MAHTFTVGQAKTQLSRLIALAEAGEEVVVRRGDVPVVRLQPLQPAVRELGPLDGQGYGLEPDFDEWPEDVARALGMVE
jgi:antitoxin (DNA-binding transcriptional repressor) of toxin-antitoxin stability system